MGKATAGALIGIVSAAAALFCGCSAHTESGTPQAQTATGSTTATAPSGSSTSECATVASPLTDIKPVAAGEPRLRIPVPPGWKPTTKMNSELVRYVAANPDLNADDFAANVVVTLEQQAPGTTEQQAFDQQRDALAHSVGIDQMKPGGGSLCGQPMASLEYMLAVGNAKPHPAKVEMVYLPVGDTPYVATVTIQSTVPENPTYQHDSQEIFDGFQMLPPA